MPLTGTYTRTIDDKQRLAVPKPLREAFGKEAGSDETTEAAVLYIAPGTDISLMVFSETGFQRYSDRFSQASVNRPDTRRYLRMFYAQAERVDVDSQGRVRIPERLMQFASLSKETVILGVHEHAELWDKERWEGFLAEHGDDFDQVAAQSFE
jgi:MraZ protein